MPVQSRPQSERGFTLMETMVAFAIFSLSVVAILQTYSLSARMQARAETAMETGELIHRLLASAEARVDGSGTFEGEQAGYSWRVDVTPVGNDLIEITADVTDPLGRREKAMTLRWQGEIETGSAS